VIEEARHMRHTMSLLLSIILAPLVYISAGVATVKVDAANAASSYDWASAALGVCAGLLAGAMYAILVMARLSPFGPVLAGLGYTGLTLWAVLDRSGFASAFGVDLFGSNHTLIAPVGAGTLLLAVPLLFTIFSPRRWRRSASPVQYATVAPAAQPAVYQPSAVYQPPGTYPPVAPPAAAATPVPAPAATPPPAAVATQPAPGEPPTSVPEEVTRATAPED
jgi:cell division septation protein DedD